MKTQTPSKPGDQIVLAHGGGGQLTDELLRDIILPRLDEPPLESMLDAAVLSPTGNDRLALTIDSYVVSPWKFPGGDIGRLAVCGSVNDLAVVGARPIGLALSLVLTEGFEKSDLEHVMDSIEHAADEAGVNVVTGDTKVVGHDQGDGILITTSALGRISGSHTLNPDLVQPGDILLINGPIGDHGLAVMMAREMPQMQTAIRSDVAPLNGLIEHLLDELGHAIVFMRDPTRSGLAGTLADLARAAALHIVIRESDIPVRPETRHAADLLGLDVLESANEGKFLMVVRPHVAEKALHLLHQHQLGQDAAIIGKVDDDEAMAGVCELLTDIGGRRVLTKPYGEQLPRIC